MTKKETAIIMDILQAAYPRFYINQSPEDKKRALFLWSAMFENVNIEVCKYAVYRVIEQLKYPPTPADVLEKIKEIQDINESTDIELWNEALKAIKEGMYFTQEKFNKLSAPVKKFFGGPSNIKEYALMDIQTVNSVIKGQFLKQIKSVIQKEEEREKLPNNIKKLLDNTNINLIGSGGKDENY